MGRTTMARRPSAIARDWGATLFGHAVGAIGQMGERERGPCFARLAAHDQTGSGRSVTQRPVRSDRRNAMLNFNAKTLDELAARIGKAVEASPAKDIEKNVKAMLQGRTRRASTS